MATNNEEFCENMKKVRKLKRLSQEQLAEKAHLDMTTVNELENRNREPYVKNYH